MPTRSKTADLFFYEELCRALGQGPALQWLLSQYANSTDSSPARSPARSPSRSPVASPNKSPIVSPRNVQQKEFNAPPPRKYTIPKGGSVRSTYLVCELDTQLQLDTQFQGAKQWTSLDGTSMTHILTEKRGSFNPCNVHG